MLEADELIFEQLSSNSEGEDEQRIMFEKAGLFLEKLALNSEEQEDKTVKITKFLMKQLDSDNKHQHELNDENDIVNLDEAVEIMLRNKDEEIDAIKLETDILFEKFLNLDESLISPKKEEEEEGNQEDEEEDQENEVEEEEEEEEVQDEEEEQEDILNINNKEVINIKEVDEESTINVNTLNEKQLKTDEILLEIDKIIIEKDITLLEVSKKENDVKENERELEVAEIMLDKLALNFEEETINTMLTTVESRQNSLQEKMNVLKSTAESLREQLKEERKKWKQEIKETVQLEKKLKNDKQEMKQQSWVCSDVEMDVFKDYLYFTNSKMNFERELKRRNYHNWLSEISDECDKQLTKVQSNLTVLKPLKEMVSKWNIQSYPDFNANLINNVTNTEEYVANLIENDIIKDNQNKIIKQDQEENKELQMKKYGYKFEERTVKNNDESNKFHMDKLDCTDVEEINFEMVTQL